MKITAFVFFCIFLVPASVFAVSPEDTRGVEEEKRKTLAPTEIQPYPAPEATELKLDQKNYVFLSELYNKKVSSIDDSCRAISIVLGTNPQFVRENLLPAPLKPSSDGQAPLRKGQAAYMLAKALKIKGGLLLRLLGLNQRYALRELVYEGIMFSGNPQELMSGKELVITLARTADYLTGVYGQ